MQKNKAKKKVVKEIVWPAKTGDPRTFSQTLSAKRSFNERVFTVVKKIPKGKTLTYGEVARRAGNPKAARAVGAVLHTNYDPKIPCHRVVKSDGTLGGYNRGNRQKQKKLESEGAR